MHTYLPVEIHHMKDKGLVRITWDDGHVGEYPREYLRGYCPCAMCQGHGGGPKKFTSGGDSKLSEIRAVGNYAVEFAWEDGHSTGIYTFDYLRLLCPCGECRSGRDQTERSRG